MVLGWADLSHWFALGMMIPPLAWYIAMDVWAEARVRRPFDAAEGRLCTECGYSLRGLGDDGDCPECGTAFHAWLDQRRWGRVGMVWRPYDQALTDDLEEGATGS